MKKTYVGFGFGAIQSGLFLYEAFRSGNFDRLVVAEVMPEVVEAVRVAGGYSLNVATPTGIEQHRIDGVEIYNPTDPANAAQLIDALADAQEIGTALPSVDFFSRGTPSVADLLRQAFTIKQHDPARPDAVVYTAENNNHAAEALEKAVGLDVANRVQFLNTVVGKMSGVVTDEAQIADANLARTTPAAARAFLVEAFNRILITKIALTGFQRGIEVLEEKDDLMPFEEAKLYGHNATHALVGYLGGSEGYDTMSAALADADVRAYARAAFLEESGAGVMARHTGVDPLFTPQGYADYVDDLLDRMANIYLQDSIERICRDPARKLGWDDRLIGTMRIALEAGVEPVRYATAVAIALRAFDPSVSCSTVGLVLGALWKDSSSHHDEEADRIIQCVKKALQAQLGGGWHVSKRLQPRSMVSVHLGP